MSWLAKSVLQSPAADEVLRDGATMVNASCASGSARRCRPDRKSEIQNGESRVYPQMKYSDCEQRRGSFTSFHVFTVSPRHNTKSKWIAAFENVAGAVAALHFNSKISIFTPPRASRDRKQRVEMCHVWPRDTVSEASYGFRNFPRTSGTVYTLWHAHKCSPFLGRIPINVHPAGKSHR